MLNASSKRILIAIAEPNVQKQLAQRLANSGFSVEVAGTVELAINKALSFLPGIVVVGNEFPDSTPFDLTRRIRNTIPPTSMPVIMMAMSDTAQDNGQLMPPNVSGVSALVGRIVGFFESQPDETADDQLECQGIRLDRGRHRTWIDGQHIKLTPTEFRLLWELVSRPGFVLSRADLTRVCKGTDSSVQTRTIDAHVKSIRRKLKDRSGLIETVHGVGYRFQELEPARTNAG